MSFIVLVGRFGQPTGPVSQVKRPGWNTWSFWFRIENKGHCLRGVLAVTSADLLFRQAALCGKAMWRSTVRFWGWCSNAGRAVISVDWPKRFEIPPDLDGHTLAKRVGNGIPWAGLTAVSFRGRMPNSAIVHYLPALEYHCRWLLPVLLHTIGGSLWS